MDAKFHPAIAAMRSGDLEGLRSMLRADPTLATARSSASHPTLLACLTLECIDTPNKLEMARALIDAGSDIDVPLGAAASVNHVEMAALLIDAGAAVDGTGGWSPLEEALYWSHRATVDLLVERGATVRNLRTAAGLGRTDRIESFFDGDGNLKPEAGKIDWPFSRDPAITSQWSHDRQSIIDNAFVYACANDRFAAAEFLLQKGAAIDAIPPGFDYAGTALHNAALHGHRAMVEFLVARGANVRIRDLKVGSTPAGWAAYAGHEEIKNYLEQAAGEGLS